jgi:hypothetical protein
MKLIGIVLFFLLAYCGSQIALRMLPDLATLAAVAFGMYLLWRRR